MEPMPATFIAAAKIGDRSAAEAVFPMLYTELHRLAERQLARAGWGATLGATSLLHEAYLDMSRSADLAFPDRGRFMAYAARVMRGLIVDYSRRQHAHKRGGQFEITSLNAAVADPAAPVGEWELSELSDALDGLAITEPELAQIVDLKFFCGFSFPEIAALRGVTERTAQRHWQKARIYLRRALASEGRGWG